MSDGRYYSPGSHCELNHYTCKKPQSTASEPYAKGFIGHIHIWTIRRMTLYAATINVSSSLGYWSPIWPYIFNICTNIHYFVIYPNYNDQRLVLLNYVSQITEPRLSYLLPRGNYELSVNANVKLFHYVQTFMHETTRFNWIYLCSTHL